MKTIKLINILLVVLFTFSCSSDDHCSDSSLPTTLDLLTSGTWYLESVSYDIITACEKETSIDFMADGSAIIKGTDESLDGCVLLEVVNTTYTLVGSTININLIDDNLLGVITYDASLQTLILTENGGGLITFDKIQG
ncbi:hypothetical protein FF125_11765 [Aureibaculum algae]|uniref:Lipocalin-like domain-containing protein n=1 Tax=Aureibaculum algae TaxID=2584122 RepID=A0A5B7TS96_9FLAO|nr:lipocalin family protein [Aureibaculum algae]QCX39078.1 hypothetical protein FF125_11765 [Aureibaculum algae]